MRASMIGLLWMAMAMALAPGAVAQEARPVLPGAEGPAFPHRPRGCR